MVGSGDSVNVSCGSITGATGTLTYSWALSGSGVGTADINPKDQKDAVISGDFVVGKVVATCTVTETLPDGTINTATSTVTIIIEPVVLTWEKELKNATLPYGSDGTQTVKAVANDGSAVTYEWQDSSTGETFVVDTNVAGSVPLTCTASNANASSITTSATITVEEKPVDPITVVVSINSPIDAAGAETVDGTATATVTGGSGNYTFTWKDPVVSKKRKGRAKAKANTDQKTYTFTANGDYVVACDVVDNDSGAKDSGDAPVTITGITVVPDLASFTVVAATDSITVGKDTTTVEAKNPLPVGADLGTVTFVSDNPTVASISGNVVTPLTTGTVTITGTSDSGAGNIKATSQTITVLEPKLVWTTELNPDYSGAVGEEITMTVVAEPA